ncbi:hypothetical protein B0181_05135 [Moraxella caviae]|uniref:Uncharacterized tRNA/rRNA methyltransferase HI_0380 n=1 Tax=Moraxella caviae TaxID=34060 RepID=A0A1T0A2T8_9GAMM|nr:TrmH family RNA methyltransferase [Moraxella caviae]OOR90043.1 hypothetical protein B0181_05135 [Moraxella caviae]STZ14644.1 Uncharacterized tRNA/rRNA methyltransferase HI_0380 [Moraxella caviae]VEW13336.1 Uncharacterized tRNA/rRNA methyltransferase HI_0380 [Moraxella caviae]
MTHALSNHTLTAWLSRIRIVMVNTTLPANIGSAARAMHTMGLSDLVVVSPRLPVDDTATANAAGGTNVLNNLRIVDSIDEAIGDCALVFAASARSRHLPKPVISQNAAAAMMAQFLKSHDSRKNSESSETPDDATLSATLNNETPNKPPRIAILFGREDRGLTNEELALASHHIQIPANPTYPVLNVAAAVQVIASAIYAKFDECAHKALPNTEPADEHSIALITRSQWDSPAITKAQQRSLEQAWIDAMVKLGLAHDGELRYLPERLARLADRVQLDQREFALLRSVLAKVSQRLD